MHPRNLYSLPLDWQRLQSSANADLRAHFAFDERYKNYTFQFKEKGALQELTRELLRADFDVNWTLRADRLCPPLPNRINYLLWLEDLCAGWSLLRSRLKVDGSPSTGTDFPRTAIDVGAGASAIFALLAHKLMGMQVLGTDVDPSSLASAEENVGRNGLQESIRLCLTKVDPSLLIPDVEDAAPQSSAAAPDSGVGSSSLTSTYASALSPTSLVTRLDSPSLLTAAVEEAQRLFCSSAAGSSDEPAIAFTVCNPPFFDSWAEAQKSMEGHEDSNCSGCPQEMACGGGEVAFVDKMITESLTLGKRVLLYSSMFGKASSVEIIAAKLHKLGVPLVRTTDLVQGKTRRWAVAWSFYPQHEFPIEGWQVKRIDKPPRPSIYALPSDATASKGAAREKDSDVAAEAPPAKRPRTEGVANDASSGPGAARKQEGPSLVRCFKMRVLHPNAELPKLEATSAGSAYLLFAGVGAAITGSAAPSTGTQPLPDPIEIAELISRMQEAIESPFTTATSAEDSGMTVEMSQAAPCVHIRDETERAGTNRSVAWFGKAFRKAEATAAEAGGAAGSAASDGGSPQVHPVCFIFELQLHLPLTATDAKIAASSDIATICASLTSVTTPVSLNRQRFDRWVERFRADVERTSRRWRRRDKAGPGAGVESERI